MTTRVPVEYGAAWAATKLAALRRARADEQFRTLLLKDPRAALELLTGVPVPEGLTISSEEASPDRAYVTVRESRKLPLWILDGVLGPTDVASLLAAIPQEAWTPASINRKEQQRVDASVRRSEVAYEDASPRVLAELKAHIVGNLSAASLPLDFGLRLSPLQVLRYRPDGYYRPHRDENGQGEKIRIWTVLVYLNDDYLGGQTHFDEGDRLVTPRLGRAVVFDSRHRHTAQPVLEGTKLVCVFWLVHEPNG